MKFKEREAITQAIRVITNDAADGKPNNESKAAMLALMKIMAPEAWGSGIPEKAHRQYIKACSALAALAEALDVEAMSLRLSAEEYFDEDFKAAPEAEVVR